MARKTTIHPEDVTSELGEVRLFKAELPERDMVIDSIAGDGERESIWLENAKGRIWTVPLPKDLYEWRIWSMDISKKTLYITLVAPKATNQEPQP